jgi:serine/threonine protein kinase
MYRTMLGIKFLYDKNLLHHDIKKQNIMLDDDLNPKLIDFEGVNKEYVKQQEDKCKLK